MRYNDRSVEMIVEALVKYVSTLEVNIEGICEEKNHANDIVCSYWGV